MPSASVSIHLLAGTVAVLFYWGALLHREGSRPHRRLGRLFLLSLVVVLASVGAVLFLGTRRFAVPEIVQFLYLALCLVTVGLTGFLAFRFKRDLDRFRGPWFQVLGGATFLMGGVVLAASIAARDPVPMVFSIIGLLFGGAMLRFAFLSGPVHPRWPLIWHLNAMCLLFNAVHGNVLAVLWRAGIDPSGGREVLVATELGTMLAALALRLWFGHRYDAPLRLEAETRPALA